MPQVSVVMPVYNGEKFLGEAIESILNQTFHDFEFLIINDGSTDCTAAILSDYQQRDDRIHVYDQENHGLITTLNRGLSLARGTYLARMDADDISFPDRLATQVAYLDNHPQVGLVSTNCYLIDATGQSSSQPLLRKLLKNLQIEWELYWGNPIVHPSVLCRTELMRACGGYPEGYKYYAEDYALWLRMIASTEMAILDQPLLYLRKHSHNVTVVYQQHNIDEASKAAQIALTNTIGYTPSSRCIRLLRQNVSDQVSTSDIKQARKLLVDAFRALAKRPGATSDELHGIQTDLAKRLFSLMMTCGKHSRFEALMLFAYAARFSPSLALSSYRIFLWVLLSPHFINIVRKIKSRMAAGNWSSHPIVKER